MASQRIPEGASFAYDTCVSALDEQLRRIESLDTKAGVLIAATGLFAGIVFSRGSMVAGAPGWIEVASAASLMLALLLALLAFANRNYLRAPVPSSVIRLMARPDEWLKWRFLGNLEEAIAFNNRKLRAKARFANASLAALLASVTGLGGYFMYALSIGRVR